MKKEKKIIPLEEEETTPIVPELEQKIISEIDECEKIKKEAQENKDKWLRTLAEFDNFRKNTLKEKQDWIRYANEKIIIDLCDVLDNFERALTTEITADNIPSYKKGIDLIFQQLNAILKKNDVIKLECLGKDFDPKFHEALSSIPSTEPENKIISIIKNGYMIGEKLIRACQVAVSKGAEPAEENE